MVGKHNLYSLLKIFIIYFSNSYNVTLGNETTQIQYTGGKRQSLDDILKMTEEYDEELNREKQAQENLKNENANEDFDDEDDGIGKLLYFYFTFCLTILFKNIYIYRSWNQF